MNIIDNCFHLLFPFSAYETSKMFTTASDSLASLDQKIFGHWRAYFNLKSKFYMSHVSIILCILQLIMYLFIYLKDFFPTSEQFQTSHVPDAIFFAKIQKG